MTRTISREHWLASQRAWAGGEFSSEWKPYRHQAAMRGFVYPPEGTKWDSWEDDSPSQRAMVSRAIEDTPKLLHEAIAHSKSWGDALGYIFRRRDEWRVEVQRALRDDDRSEEPSNLEATVALKHILDRILDS